MPVRTAFQRLQALRALELLPNGSVEVPLLIVEGFSNLTEARIAIESVATILAAPRLTASQLKTIRRHCEERTFAARAGDIDRYLQANFDFKFAIYQQCGNAHLFFLIETLWLQAGPFLRKFVEGSGFLITEILDVDSHYRVLKALEAREPDEAAAAIVADIRDAASHLLKHAHFGGIPI